MPAQGAGARAAPGGPRAPEADTLVCDRRRTQAPSAYVPFDYPHSVSVIPTSWSPPPHAHTGPHEEKAPHLEGVAPAGPQPWAAPWPEAALHRPPPGPSHPAQPGTHSRSSGSPR